MRKAFPIIASICSIVVGLAVMVGWLIDSTLLISIKPEWVSMKFLTAFCFVTSGFIVVLCQFVVVYDSNLARGLLPIPCCLQLLVVMVLATTSITGNGTGLEELFVKDKIGAPLEYVPGVPSLGTLLAFGVIAWMGLGQLGLTHIGKVFRAGVVLTVVAIISLFGYATQISLFSFYLPGVSSGMAFHTACLLLLLGLGSLQLSSFNDA